MPATVTQCAVLLAGRDPTLRPLPLCGDRPFLAWLLREFIRYGVTDFLLLISIMADMPEPDIAAIQATLPRPVRITLSRHPANAGTGGALLHARDELEDRFLLCNGSTLFDGNLATLLADAAQDKPGVMGRMLLQQQADRTVPSSSDRVTGIGLFNKSLLACVLPQCDLQTDILPPLAKSGALRITLAHGRLHAIEPPAGPTQSRANVPNRLLRNALFLDRDGVLNIDHGFVGSVSRFEWVEGALAAIRYATEAGWHVFIVTNQSGVARGYYTEADVRHLLGWVADQARGAGGTIDDARYCPYHPTATVEAYRQAHPWRKPLPGMLLDLIATWNLDPRGAIMIGDQPTDMQAAAAAGITSHLFTGGNLLAFLQPILEKFVISP